MNAIQLSKKIGMIDSDLIDEAANAHRHIKRSTWMKWSTVAAAVICIAVGFSVLMHHKSEKRIAGLDHPSSTSISYEKAVDRIKYSRSNQLDIVSCSFNAEGMGEDGGNGHLIVKKYSDAASANPTRNNVDGISELPVFKNEKGLWSSLDHDISNIKAQIYFDNPAYEVTRDYDYNGISNNTWNLCFKSDKSKKITDQLLDYTFYRIEYAVYDINGERSGWSKTLKPPAKPGILYPIITREEAEQKFRKGNFFSFGGEIKVAKTADIISVELEYLTDEYQTYIQPYYKFIIHDKSWNTLPMKCKNKNEFTSVSPIFVPALKDKYLKITKPTTHYN